ncbi:MAG: HNH endonuclease, partial [Desulfobacteraceae bacterium]|nr:HNH endonuclease [Desulfobacteraceae bacterium]
HFPPAQLTMDHIIPVGRGGKSEKFNLVPCCKECNTQKSNLLPSEWEDYMETLRK